MSETLGSIITSIAYKSLVHVDLPNQGSNQHEINSVNSLRDLFQTDIKISGNISWRYFCDDLPIISEEGQFTFYDARARSAHRTGRSPEWRLYYTGDFLSNARLGDVLIIIRTVNSNIFGLIFSNNSTWLRSALVLFSIGNIDQNLSVITRENLTNQNLEFAQQQILDELGIEVLIPSTVEENDIALQALEEARAIGRNFPSTNRMANLAQSLVEVNFNDGDTTLVQFLEKEERIFKAIERILVQDKLNQGFSSVDDFISYSLSVQNRRKSRMGFALQNHLSCIFRENRILFSAQVHTEHDNIPDFIFPGGEQYWNPNFDSNLLTMLAAKSSCKERWKQILDEAEKIPNKHLCTLETAISPEQTQSMIRKNVRLVIPSSFFNTYLPSQLENIWSINQFLEYVRYKQRTL